MGVRLSSTKPEVTTFSLLVSDVQTRMLFAIRDGNCCFKDIKHETGTAETGDMGPEGQGEK